MAAHRLRRIFVDSDASVGGRARRRRWERFTATFPGLTGYSVLDLGGTVEFWSSVPGRPASVHLINVEAPTSEVPSWIRADVADACAPPSGLLDPSYDLVYSNSVIEHVGGHARRAMFAERVRESAPRWWIQTPYRYFPVEPHWVAPAMQFLPLRGRALYARAWPLAHSRPRTFEEAVNQQLSVELLDATQMATYFPEAELRRERLFGLTKSLISVRAD